MPCSFTATSCTSDQVRATLMTLLERSGATATEATCLATLSAHGAHSITDAFRPRTSDDGAEAIRCVGSAMRLGSIAAKVLATLTQVAPQIANLMSPQECKSGSGEEVVPISRTSRRS